MSFLSIFRCAAFCALFVALPVAGAAANSVVEEGSGEEALRKRVGLVVLATEEYRSAFGDGGELVDEEERLAAQKILESVEAEAPSEEIEELLELVRAKRPVEDVYAARDEWFEEHALGIKPERPERALSRADGEALYVRYCVACHGDDGGGNGPATRLIEGPPPANFLDSEFMEEETPEEFFQAITLGVPGSAMPEWGEVLESQERWDLIAFLWSLRPVPADLPNPISCTACHGSKGPARNFTVPGAIANVSDRKLAENASVTEAHKTQDGPGLTSLVHTARLFDLASDGASVATFERRQIPRLLDLLVDEYSDGVENGEVLDELEYFEAQTYLRRVTEDIERVIGTGGMDSASVQELLGELGKAIDEKAPSDDVAGLAERLKSAVKFNLSDS